MTPARAPSGGNADVNTDVNAGGIGNGGRHMRRRRTADGAAARAVGLAMLALGGCAHAPELPPASGTTPLLLEGFFAGRTQGFGVFTNTWTGEERSFEVTIEGRWDGRTLTLVEVFVYADGEIDRKTWVLAKNGDGTYTGTREDVVGEALAFRDGLTMRLEYEVLLGTGDDATEVRFKDVLGLNPDGTLTNLAVVSKWGFQVGRVELHLAPAPGG